MLYEPLEVTTHDYRKHTRKWGHDYTWRPRKGGHEGTMIGWGRGLQGGDYVWLSLNDIDYTRYQINSVRYAADPSDMFFAELIWRPR